jgi:4-hydroxybenzoate polyprenyltransferase
LILKSRAERGIAILIQILEGYKFRPEIVNLSELYRRPKTPFEVAFPRSARDFRIKYSVPLLTNIRTTLEMIKWEHSIFALPFALCAAMLAAGGMPTAAKLGWIVLCMISARSAAMAFNRIADARIDAANPRTAMRAIPAGALSQKFAMVFVVVACLLFIVGAAELNRATLLLSPVALAVMLFYSYTKRFTRWSHLVLGFALGIAPAAAWIAVRGSLDPRILLLTTAVTFWVGGFDVLYACQDIEFDRANSLNSIPQALGVPKALIVARTLHVLMLGLLIALVVVFGLGKLAIVGVVVVAALLAYEHSLVASDDLSKLNAAFFTMNGVIAVVFFVFVAADLLLRAARP